MADYIDGFVLTVPRDQLEMYREVVEEVAEIWKENGALEYSEYVIDDPTLEGTQSFIDAANAIESEVVIFGWVVFESREARDLANQKVAADSRMVDLIAPLTNTSTPIFSAERMIYGGFRSLVKSSN